LKLSSFESLNVEKGRKTPEKPRKRTFDGVFVGMPSMLVTFEFRRVRGGEQEEKSQPF
jgi:hypothetical protein